jgi:glycogen debranching enzyme
MPLTQVQALLPALRAALSWLVDFADPDEDGFLEYIDQTGRGLANQGWKDSGDSIQFRDGRLAAPPIALCEVQAYAYEAALTGATLLRAFGTGQMADRLEEWAAKLRSAFRSAFWIRDAAGPYPAVALDGGKHPVDTVTSNLGHLLGTGLLDRAESALVAGRLAALDAGFGLRTLAADSAGFNPLGYHTGSIWPHDTAIAAFGLRRAGFGEQALRLAHGVVAASVAFDARLPELYAGDSAAEGRLPQPAPYPAACRPQAWAAAGVVLMLQALLGLSADVPGGTVRVKPVVNGLPVPLRVDGLWIAGQPLRVAIAADGSVTADSPGELRVVREAG